MVTKAVLSFPMAVEEVVHLYLGVQAQTIGNQAIGFFQALLQSPRSSLKDHLPIRVLVTRILFINL
jgi:hypothetical protein